MRPERYWRAELARMRKNSPAVTPCQAAIILAPEGRHRGRPDIDGAVDRRGRVDAEERHAQVRHRIDQMADVEARGRIELPVDAP